jgi:uncharacterized SAM-binding protein YcdF (DUF218 family)
MDQSIKAKGAVRLRRVGEFLLGRVMLVVFALLVITTVAILLRVPLLRAVGNFLVRADATMPSDALYVLGGAPLERGQEGALALAEGVAAVAYCTGSQVPRSLELEGIDRTEAALSRNVAIAAGADSAQVRLLEVGTSTLEEAQAIVAHALAAGYDDITIISTEFHSRRVGRVFRKQAAGTGLRIHVRIAASQVYDSAYWWKSEEGLLMVNNEYVKLLYYLIKY